MGCREIVTSRENHMDNQLEYATEAREIWDYVGV